MQNIGRYQIESELGKGAMGVVYKAIDPNIGRTVALKTTRVDVHGIETEEMVKRFRNEARSAGVLNHPNIVTIYDAGEEQGLFYIAMEFIEGQTLAEVLQKQRVLPVEQIAAITRHVCAGLDFAHGKGIIHRDIKPANIMIANDGTSKIMDFGIAKGGGSMTSTGQVLGTPNYMSPEQVRGRQLDGRTDLFSLGVVLYEMLTGEKPFAGQNVTTIIYKIVNENPIPPRELDLSVHPGLNAVVSRALAKDPNERYQSGAELAKDLENYKSYSDGNATISSMTSALTGVTGGDQTLLTPAPVAAVAKPAPEIPPPARVAPPPSAATPIPAKSSNRVILASAVAVIIVLALFVVARYNAKRNADPERIREAMQMAQETSKLGQQIQNSQSGVPAANTPSIPTAPPTPAQPAIMTADVSVTSQPAGAKVEIDGRSKDGWVTPFSEKLEPGNHTVSFTLENYDKQTKTVEVTAGKKSNVSARLATNFGTVRISSEPAADILLNGQPTGKQTPAEFVVPPGNQSFTLRKQGFEDSGDTVSVAAGQYINITPQLTPQQGQNPNPFGKLGRFLRGQGAAEDRGLLVIRTRPLGARVALNGRTLPLTTPMRIPIRSGHYTLQITMPGYQTLSREVTVVRGKQTGLDEELVRK